MIIKGKLFGNDYLLDLETAFPTQVFYYYRLKVKAAQKQYLSRAESREFIKYALHHLPLDSYVIFYFGKKTDCFIQFVNTEGNRVLDIPFCDGNIFYGNHKAIAALLRSENINRSKWSEGIGAKPKTFFTVPVGDNDISIEVDFGSDYGKAAKLALLVAKKVCHQKNPIIVKFESGKIAYRP